MPNYYSHDNMHFEYNLGPLTFSDDCGKRTIFGIVSGPGNLVSSGVSETTAFARVSHPRILDWIRNTMKSYFKWYLILVKIIWHEKYKKLVSNVKPYFSLTTMFISRLVIIPFSIAKIKSLLPKSLCISSLKIFCSNHILIFPLTMLVLTFNWLIKNWRKWMSLIFVMLLPHYLCSFDIRYERLLDL